MQEDISDRCCWKPSSSMPPRCRRLSSRPRTRWELSANLVKTGAITEEGLLEFPRRALSRAFDRSAQLQARPPAHPPDSRRRRDQVHGAAGVAQRTPARGGDGESHQHLRDRRHQVHHRLRGRAARRASEARAQKAHRPRLRLGRHDGRRDEGHGGGSLGRRGGGSTGRRTTGRGRRRGADRQAGELADRRRRAQGRVGHPHRALREDRCACASASTACCRR